MINRIRSFGAVFAMTVVLPTLIAVVYFGLIASDIYISESRFVVRSPGKPSASPIGMILSAGGFANANEENHSVVEYVRSRNALTDSNRDGLVRAIYGGVKGSPIDRFGAPFGGTSDEQLYRYFNDKVQIEFDTASQVTRLTVRAFAPEDARMLNRRLLEQSEALINRLSERGRLDAIAAARTETAEAKRRAREAVVALARFRNRNGLLDPEKQAAIGLQMVSKLQDELIAQQTLLSQLQIFTPRNPQIPSVRTRITSLQREIAKQEALVAGAPTSLSAAASQYQQLQFDAEFAAKQLAISLSALQEAENEARKKQVYVERIAAPSLPDYALEPRRWRNIFATLILGLLAWGVVSTLLAGIREHRD